MESKLKPRSGDCENSTGQGCAEDRSTPRPRCRWQHPLKDERLRAPGLNNKSPIRVRMEARRRAAPAKSLVPSVALSLRPDHLRYGRLRPPSKLCAALRPLTRQGLDCGPRRPDSPTIRAKGKRKWPFPPKNHLTQQLHGSRFCNCRCLQDKSGDFQTDFPLVNSLIALAGIRCIARQKTTSKETCYWFGARGSEVQIPSPRQFRIYNLLT